MKRIVYESDCLKQLLKFPESVKMCFAQALDMEAMGVRHPNTKTLRGFGNAQVCEIREWSEEGTFRVVFTVKVRDRLYVLHAFQKKSTKGASTSKKDLQLIQQRLKRLSI